MAWSDAARQASIAARRNRGKGTANNKQAAILFRKSALAGSQGLNAYRRATGRPGLEDRKPPPKVSAPAKRVAGNTRLKAAQGAYKAGIAVAKGKKGTRANRFAPQNKGGLTSRSTLGKRGK